MKYTTSKFLKIITSMFLIFVSFTAQSQENHFSIEEGKVVWQNVFVKKNLSADSLLSAFKSYLLPTWNAQEIQTTAEGFLFKVKDGVIDFKKYGGNNLNTGLFARQGHAFTVLAQFREGRYRITLSQIENIEMRMESVNQPIEESVLKRGEDFYTSGMVKKGLKVMDAYFLERFTLPEQPPKAQNHKKDDW